MIPVAGLGVVALGVGTLFGLRYKSKNDEAKAICPSSSGCSAVEIDQHSHLLSDAKAYRTGAFIGFGVGGAALISAAVLYFAPKRNSGTSGFQAAPFITHEGAWGATAVGNF